MKRYVLFTLLLGSISSAEIIKPSLFIAPENRDFLSPAKIMNQKFFDSNGKSVNLPSKNRYLVWLADALFALDDSKEIKQPNKSGENTYYNIKNYVNVFDNKQSYVIFYNNIGQMPELKDLDRVQKKLDGIKVLFDQDDNLTESVSFSGFSYKPNIAGLYFMEGQTIMYRFLTNNSVSWNYQEVTPVIQKAAKTFLNGGSPKDFTPTLMKPGAVLPKTLWNAGKPTLFFRISGNELDVPEAPLMYNVTRRSDGSETSEEVGNPPSYVQQRFVLDNLPALTRSSGVQLVALTMNNKRLADLKKAFPAWTFLPLDTPEKRLGWYDVSALLVDAQGKVRLPFYIFPSTSKSTAILENALDAVKP